MTLAKICGLSTLEAVDAAVEAGADYVGFVHHRASPRHISLERLRGLVRHTREAGQRHGRSTRTVVLMADPEVQDHAWAEVVCAAGADAIQLHGRETLEQVGRLRRDAERIEIIKALPVASKEDLEAARAYEAVVDRLMFDARPPEGSNRTGGHGLAFDWTLLADFRPSKPWFLAGGLTPDNVAEAVRATGAPGVDVSSGVESAPGVKDPALITAFLRAVRSA